MSHRFRFTSTSATATAITPTSLLGACGAMGTVVNAFVTTIADAVRVNLIEIWSPPASQGAAATCSVDFLGFGNSPNVEVSDTTVSVANPAHILTSPPAQSLASFWQVGGATTLFTITAPVGSIIDVHLSFILDDGGEVGQAIAVATSVVQTLYYLSLDPVATHRYTPVSLTTTF